MLHAVAQRLGNEVVFALLPVRDYLGENVGFENGPGEGVLAEFLRLLDDDHGILAALIVEELFEPDGPGQAGRPGADKQDIYLILVHLCTCRVQGLDKLRDDIFQIPHDAEVGYLEDAGVGVLVDG